MQDFCVDNCPLHTMVRGQIHAGVKCLKYMINNVTDDKKIYDHIAHTLKNIPY